MLRRILFFAALSTITFGVQAKVKLPHIIGDNMILQQDSEARLWGWDTPGKTVKVSVSWSKESYSAKTDSNGKWIVGVKTPKASYTSLSITFNDGDKTTINDVLSGEVWVCLSLGCVVARYTVPLLSALFSKVRLSLSSKLRRHSHCPIIASIGELLLFPVHAFDSLGFPVSIINDLNGVQTGLLPSGTYAVSTNDSHL